MNVRRAGIGLLVAWMVLGPIATQVFGVRNPFLPAWHMYRGWGSDIVVVRMERVDHGHPEPIDRVAVLGLGPSVNARRVRDIRQLDQQIRAVCAALPGADVRVHAKIGRVRGWQTVRDGAHDACR